MESTTWAILALSLVNYQLDMADPFNSFMTLVVDTLRSLTMKAGHSNTALFLFAQRKMEAMREDILQRTASNLPLAT